MPSCRQAFDRVPLARGAHAGLLLAAHYRGNRNEPKQKPQAETDLLKAAQTALKNAQPLYRLAFERWQKATEAAPTRSALTFKTTGRVLCGLGSKGVLESGISLSHTYGTPYLPATSLKGIGSHYCAEVWGAEQSRYSLEGDVHQLLFGTTAQAGYLIFHDGWILPDDCSSDRRGLVRDVITPHHQDYHQEGSHAAPQPFDDPVPIQLLSVAGSFRVTLEVDAAPSPESIHLLGLGTKILQGVLADWGVGAKTSSGYGRMMAV